VAKICAHRVSGRSHTGWYMGFDRPRTKNYSVAALSRSTIRGFRAVRLIWILSPGAPYQVVQTATARPCCAGRSRQAT